MSLGRIPFSKAEISTIERYYRDEPDKTFDLYILAAALGRPRTSICRIARKMGLTRKGRMSEENRSKTIEAGKGKWSRAPHPRGACGLVHSEQTRKVISEKSKKTWELHKKTSAGLMSPERLQQLSDRQSVLMASANPEKMYSRGAAGYREDLGPIYFRSRWEANYARYLNWLMANGEIESWEYEPDTFWFEAIKRGVRSYKPDFKIREKGKTYYVEVKGYMDAKSATKIKRMRIYYPDIELRVIAQKEYRDISRSVSALIPEWETQVSGKRLRGNLHRN